MMVQFRPLAKAIAALVALTAAGLPVAAQAPELAMLTALDRGAWEVRYRPSGETAQMCVRTGRELIQLRHRQAGCTRFVVDDEENVVTVQYTCRGDGYGRTSIRRENSGLVQIRSQGIQGGTPFNLDAEARHKGAC